jgi:hypothetical protein
MRSHLTINSTETDEKLSRIKVSSFNNGRNQTNAEMGLEAGIYTGYGLRENPKKTRRLADSSEENSLYEKLCKECGKKFLSWKALFGHMKCHSEKEKGCNSLEDQDSWISANQKLVMDSQSDNETENPSRRRRSERRTRYMATATSSSFSLANGNSSSVSEIEQEQEEVAMCLMMLSRDVGHWGGLNSSAESSDNNSVYLEALESFQTNRISKIDGKTSVCNGGSETVKLKKLSDKNSEDLKGRRSEFCAPGNSRSRSRRNKTEASTDGFFKNDHFGLEDSEVELGKNFSKETALSQAQLASVKCNSSKRKLGDSYDPELRSDQSLKTLTTNSMDSEICKNSSKRSKFECTTCNRTFHSYQALGGHRASHKKIKGCFASKIESSENSIETEQHSPDPTADSKLIKFSNNENPIPQEIPAGYGEKRQKTIGSKKSNKGHECPICLKVFPSGQALGGHKRSHLVGGSEARNNPTTVIQKEAPETRDFLDLNLPAPVEEESSNNGRAGFTPWWVGSTHKRDALVGLISN